MSLGTPEALRHLRRDAVLKRVIRQVGPFTLKPARRQPYEALVRAIAHARRRRFLAASWHFALRLAFPRQKRCLP